MAENATKCSAADGVTQTFDFCHGTPLMVRAVDFNALHAEAESLRKDAERYRHLRRPDVDIEGCALIYCTESLDEIVDASIEAFDNIARAACDELRGVPTELLACLIDARDDVAAELQRCREAAGYPSTDRRLAAQEALMERVDAAIAAAEDQPPVQLVKRLGNPDLIRMWGSRSDGPENSEILSFARAVEIACAKAWGVKLEDKDE